MYIYVYIQSFPYWEGWGGSLLPLAESLPISPPHLEKIPPSRLPLPPNFSCRPLSPATP